MSKWFAFSPAVGMSFHNSPEAAKEWAQTEMDDCRECMDDGWDEELVDSICWGKVAERAKEFIHPGPGGSNYELMPV